MATERDIENLRSQLSRIGNDQLKQEYLNRWEGKQAIAQILPDLEDASQALRLVGLALETDPIWGANLAATLKPDFQAKAFSAIAKLDLPLPQKIRLLGRTRSPKLIPVMHKALIHPDENVRAWGAWALVQIGTKAVVNSLRPSLHHPTPHARLWVPWVLGQIGRHGAIWVLIDALNHKDSQVRWRAAIALGRIGNNVAVAKLLELLFNDRDSYVRGRTASALGLIGGEKVAEGLQLALYDPDFYVHAKAVYALGTLGTRAAVAALLQALDHPHLEVRRAAVSILGEIGTEEAIVGILRSLDDSDLFVRARAVEALGQVNTEAALAGLKQALNDADAYVRGQAAAALGKRNSFANSDPRKNVSALTQPQILPRLWICSFARASEYLFSPSTGPAIKYLISIGNPGSPLPKGYHRVPHKLRLEFDDIDIPRDDPEEVLPDSDIVRQIVEFAEILKPENGELLVHCQAGISRSSAAALIVGAKLLGSGREEDALAYVLAANPHVFPNLWIVELADEALNRGGRLLQIAQQHREVIRGL